MTSVRVAVLVMPLMMTWAATCGIVCRMPLMMIDLSGHVWHRWSCLS